MWNSLDLECPVNDLVSYPPPDHYILENLRDFVTVLTTAADTLTSDSPLWNEVKVLRNIQAKYKRILRCDKFLMFTHRVSHCLRKMVLLNLSKSYLDLAERFLNGFQVNPMLQDPRLPSRQQVEYILLRTLSASRLVSEAITYSQQSFCYLIQKLKVGHLILDLIMATSILARLNILLRATLEQLSSIYKQVLFWRYKVKKGEFQWIEEINLPQDVEEWIKSFSPELLKSLSMSKEDIVRVKSMLNQMNGPNKEEEVMEISDTESVVCVNDAEEKSPDVILTETDFGDVVPRVVNENSPKSAKKKKYEKLLKKKQIEADFNILTNLQKSTLKKILVVENLKDLENLWYEVIYSSNECFPGILTAKRKEKIRKLFTELKKAHPPELHCEPYKNKPEYLKIAILHVCKKLGFTNDHVMHCKKTIDSKPESETDSLDEIRVLDTSQSLVPVRSLKKLRLLYKQLKEILEFNDETEKIMTLQSIFEHRITDIKRLKDKRETKLSRKLIYCTSKEFIALYK